MIANFNISNSKVDDLSMKSFIEHASNIIEVKNSIIIKYLINQHISKFDIVKSYLYDITSEIDPPLKSKLIAYRDRINLKSYDSAIKNIHIIVSKSTDINIISYKYNITNCSFKNCKNIEFKNNSKLYCYARFNVINCNFTDINNTILNRNLRDTNWSDKFFPIFITFPDIILSQISTDVFEIFVNNSDNKKSFEFNINTDKYNINIILEFLKEFQLLEILPSHELFLKLQIEAVLERVKMYSCMLLTNNMAQI